MGRAGTRPARRARSDAEVAGELVELALGTLLLVAVPLAELAGELVALPGDRGQVVVGQLAPLLLHLPGHLLPVPGDLIPVHVAPPRKGPPTGPVRTHPPRRETRRRPGPGTVVQPTCRPAPVAGIALTLSRRLRWPLFVGSPPR